jgi:hypothetical protein
MDAVAKAGDDPEARADIVEVQARMLGISIAAMSGGDTGAINTLLEGSLDYAMEQAATYNRIGGLVQEALRKASP